MDSIADAEAPEAALAIPRLEDGFVNMRGQPRQLAESVVNEMMSAEADQLCEATGNGRSGYRERGLVTCVGTLASQGPEAAHGQPPPRRRDRTLPEGGRGGRGRDARHRHQHEEGAGGVAAAMGVERLSKDQASAMCEHLDSDVFCQAEVNGNITRN